MQSALLLRRHRALLAGALAATLAAGAVAAPSALAQVEDDGAVVDTPSDVGEPSAGTGDPAETGTDPSEADGDAPAPGTGEPGTGEPGTGEPGTDAPGTQAPGTEEPGNARPEPAEPGTGTDEPATGGEPTEDGDGAPVGTQAVRCDAERLDDEDEVAYLFVPGERVTCVAEGLDPAADAVFEGELFGLTEADLGEAGEDVEDRPIEVYEQVLTPAADGTATFAFAVPAEVLVGELFGVVRQGRSGAETFHHEFYGLVFGGFELTFGELDCPDPVTAGTTGTCTAQDMTAGEFAYAVQYFSLQQLVEQIRDLGDLVADLEAGEIDDEEAFELFGEPDVVGVANAGSDGVGSFDFAVPTGRQLDFYVAVAAQESGYLALSAGEIVPAGTGGGTGGSTGGSTGSSTGGSTGGTSNGGATPVAVVRPNRVEAGAGGAAEDTGLTALVGLLGLAAVTGLSGTRRLLRR
ncbi:hypothetical protein [Egicoccus halophilus]|uniref:Gram-positive cocci surface proteins LPxTG domain-containing protein n=1 Tax=Egicoccus halophilus TaxID=1670830 RepID=A0A8J3EXC9_9ACTN|nr:hypothetical protein [Egicoccus halophilus]GGI05502.1 hypothetical protein GCM10011354_14420 [Egicoccus halophilus]